MPGTVTLLGRSQRYPFWTVATGKSGGRSYWSARSAGCVWSSLPDRVPGGVDRWEIGLPLWFYPVPFPMSSIYNRVRFQRTAFIT